MQQAKILVKGVLFMWSLKIKQLGIQIFSLSAFTMSILSLVVIFLFLVWPDLPHYQYSLANDFSWAGLNLFLFLVFAIHHSLMARTRTKQKLFSGKQARSRYLFVSALLSIVMVYFWGRSSVTIWELESPGAYWLVVGLNTFCWLLMVLSVLRVGFVTFFGLDKILPVSLNTMAIAFPYNLVRHPISSCWILICLLVPHMTLDKVLFALLVFLYIQFVTRYEEKDLLNELGEGYRTYSKITPKFVPSFSKLKEKTSSC